MKQSCVQVLCLFVAMATQCQTAAVPSHSKASLMSINPPLKNVASDKKFFGPPFPADYPDDKRPTVRKSIMDRVRGPGEPYPALQSAQDFDSDYVKDENSDTGMWKAQFEYDAARKRLLDEESDERKARDAADKAGSEADDARKGADDAKKNADDAQKEVDDAKAGEDKDDNDPTPDAVDEEHESEQETLESLKRKVKEAEEAYEKQKKAFEECERQLKEAKEEVEKLKAELADMEAKVYGDAKLYAEQKAVRMNALKAKQDAEKAAAAAKTKTAQEKLAKAQAAKADADKKLAKEKAEHEQALTKLKKEEAEMDQTKRHLEEAQARLQKLRGHKPGLKSGSHMASMLSFLILFAAHAVF